MPDIDVSAAITSFMLSDAFTVQRRSQSTDSNGRVQISVVGTFPAFGVVTPASPAELERLPDYQIMRKAIQVVTEFRLQGPSPGLSPDIVIWPAENGDAFVVTNLEDYSAFGGGFVSALCQSMDFVDQPPAA